MQPTESMRVESSHIGLVVVITTELWIVNLGCKCVTILLVNDK